MTTYLTHGGREGEGGPGRGANRVVGVANTRVGARAPVRALDLRRARCLWIEEMRILQFHENLPFLRLWNPELADFSRGGAGIRVDNGLIDGMVLDEHRSGGACRARRT